MLIKYDECPIILCLWSFMCIIQDDELNLSVKQVQNRCV
ncbi:hypothetical protein EJK55_0627 [Moraxella catarrhalis]|uniref:Uncharacterized protein n=1 Tax=Moraxella catarrhalis TaxID=480 RepID=A0A3Q9GCM0_MORCA|nr:hypothetical protein EJK51_1567 [Moraxella catarrhalis]EKF82984.1 hypothetical protein MCRH_1580 [Moraxella catarrhalis RH4]AZQ94003.1 hypothetical protein EJK53_1822 [Moraxella catarrhalis]AZQ96245.1 hypothetical protein EJK48_1656 [Moraxella catarrhalis]RUO11790.1 hypothetical protein EJK55_0627 [Moraxella catarrhalis]